MKCQFIIDYYSFITNIFICKLTKVGDFEGQFLRRKLTFNKNSEFTNLIYPNIPDEYEFHYSQVIERLDPPKTLRRGVLQFNVQFQLPVL